MQNRFRVSKLNKSGIYIKTASASAASKKHICKRKRHSSLPGGIDKAGRKVE